jgi:anaerobic magnesium-protoporphyrin IX monomethyl ester cyclase
MAELLLAHNYHLPLDPHEAALGRPYPPLGTLVTATELEGRGVGLAVYDPTFTATVATFDDALRGHRPRRVALVADPHAVPQKMCTLRMREAAYEMIGLAKRAGARVLVSGPDASDRPEGYRQAGADVVVVGEHDDAVLAFAAGEPIDGVLPRGRLRDLDGLPNPAWDRVDLAAYARAWRRSAGRWEMNVSTARGCPYRCNWCAKPTWGRSYRVRPAEQVVAEVLALRRAWAPDGLWFTDDIFAVKPAWLRRFRELLPAPVPYRCLTRVDLLRDAPYVADLAATGCTEVWLGAESGSQGVLDAMDKECTVAEIERAAALLQDHGIRRGFFLQLGYPGETAADVDATIRMVRALRPEEIGVSVSYPLPGTVFHDRVRAKMRGTNWETAMDNTLLYESPYPQAFYDAAREVLRAEHAILSFRPELSRRGARRAATLGWHAARWPVERARMRWWGMGTA